MLSHYKFSESSKVIYDLFSIVFHIITIFNLRKTKQILIKNYFQLTSISFFSSFLFFIFSLFSHIFSYNFTINAYILSFSFTINAFVFEAFWILYALYPKALNNNEIKLNKQLSFSLHGGNFMLILFKILLFQYNGYVYQIDFWGIFIMFVIYFLFGRMLYIKYKVSIYPIFRKGVYLNFIFWLLSILFFRLNIKYFLF